MREAKERADYERDKENKRREKIGLPRLPDDTYENQYQSILHELFETIEQKKVYIAKLDASKKIVKLEDLENKRMLDQYKIYTEEEWETTREQRVINLFKYFKTK